MSTPRITVYTTAKCPHCRQVKQFLQQQGLRFQEFDIETNARARKAFDRLGARGVPVTMIGDQRIDGFNRGVLEQALRQQRGA